MHFFKDVCACSISPIKYVSVIYIYTHTYVCVYLHMPVLSHFSRVRLSATPWIIAHQRPLSIGFSRQEYWRGLPWPPPGGLPDPGIEPASPTSPALQADFFFLTTELPGKPMWVYMYIII